MFDIYLLICMSMSIFIHGTVATIRIFMQTYARYMYIYIYIHVYLYMYAYRYIHVHRYIHKHVHTYTYTYIYAYIHTYTYITLRAFRLVFVIGPVLLERSGTWFLVEKAPRNVEGAPEPKHRPQQTRLPHKREDDMNITNFGNMQYTTTVPLCDMDNATFKEQSVVK